MKKRFYMLAVGLLCVASALWAQQPKELYLLHTSDTHSRIEPLPPHAADPDAGRGGVARRAVFIKQFKAEHPNTLVLDCGDISQGTPYYNFYKGELEVKMMNHMGYDAMAIGNHEFDFGMDNLARLLRLAEFPTVCANYRVQGTVLEGLVKPYIVLERFGLRIGIFGLGPQTEGLVQADKCAGVVYEDPVQKAQEVTDVLRDKEQCDVVICLSHLGIQGITPDVASDEQLATHTCGIDVILGGHSHTFMKEATYYTNTQGREVPVFHTGKNGVYVGRWKLTLTEK